MTPVNSLRVEHVSGANDDQIYLYFLVFEFSTLFFGDGLRSSLDTFPSVPVQLTHGVHFSTATCPSAHVRSREVRKQTSDQALYTYNVKSHIKHETYLKVRLMMWCFQIYHQLIG